MTHKNLFFLLLHSFESVEETLCRLERWLFPPASMPVPPCLPPALSPCLNDLPELPTTLMGHKMAFPDVPEPHCTHLALDGDPQTSHRNGTSSLGCFPTPLHVKPLGFVLSGPSPRIQWLQFDHLLFLYSVQLCCGEITCTFPVEEGGGIFH